MFKLNFKNIAWLIGYLIAMFVVYYGMSQYRTKAFTTYGSEEAAANWQEWRAAADEMGRSGSVEREAPQSHEPPSLVLMRDHFPACLGISLLLSSCLYLWFMVCVRGVMKPVQINHD